MSLDEWRGIRVRKCKQVSNKANKRKNKKQVRKRARNKRETVKKGADQKRKP